MKNSRFQLSYLMGVLAVQCVTSACTADLKIPDGIVLSCEDNSECPAGVECKETDDGAARVCVADGEPFCGNGVQETGETCDDGDVNTNTYGPVGRCNADCDGYAPHCGDGVENGSESCDQGAANTDAYGIEGSCNLECTGLAPHCGDAIVNGGEVCDLGTDNNTDTYGGPNRCNTACTGFASHCGDNVQDATEACDDGNVLGDDYCAPDCSAITTVCGDGIVAGSEVCDDGPSNADGYSGNIQVCNTSCSGLAPHCGDGSRTDNEVCDDGAQNSNTYNGSLTNRELCNSTCDGYRAHCGDGVVEPDGVENCDDGNTDGGDYCGKDCLSFCGDGIVDGANFETCDDGNGILTDACPDGENGTCRLAECGDGFVFNGGGEDCESSLEQATCSSIASVYQAGTVSCSGECLYDFSTCFNDPDNMVEGMVYVPPGTFWMGCNEEVDSSCSEDEYPYHEVYLDGFYIDTTKVTAAAYKACVDAGGCFYEGSTTDEMRTYNNGKDDHPINYVNHTEAKAYCEAQGKRLPTEAEWEKAARGTDGRIYPWGNEVPTCDLAVMNGCPGDTQPVGSLSAGASPYGAMDMAGNVWEWTADWYSSGYYTQTPAGGWVNPEGPDSGSARVLRGGSFYYGHSYDLRASDRDTGSPGNRNFLSGFRCAQ